LVLFADQDNLVLEAPERPKFYRLEGRWLRLTEASHAEVTNGDIARWAEKPRRELFE
jgi:hypothetical protein